MNTAVADRPPQKETPIAYVMRRLDEIEAEWPTLLTNPHLKFHAEKEWFVQACEKSNYATDIAAEKIDATMSALRNVAAVGVTLDPARKLAYALPRDKKMVYDLSYMGLIDVAIRSGAIQWAQAHMVYEKDTFKLRGYDAAPIHERNPFSTDRGDVIGVYVVAKTIQGDYLTTTMAIADVLAIRDRSPAWKGRDVNKKGSGGPWETDFDEMAKKTVVKNAYKYWPRTVALDNAIHYLNTDAGQGIDLTPADESATLVKIWTNKVNEASDAAAVAAVWLEAREAFKDDPDGLGEVRAVVAARNRALGVAPAPKPPATATAPTTTPAPTRAPANTPAPAAARPDPNATRQLSPHEQKLAELTRQINTAGNYDALTALGQPIDDLAADIATEAGQDESDAVLTTLNNLYTARMKFLDTHGGVAPKGK